MLVLVNRDNMTIVRAHPDSVVLSHLGHIELGHAAVHIFEGADARAWERFTDMELRLVYRNTCAQELVGYTKAAHAQTVAALCNGLKQSDVNPFEAHMQANAIGMDDRRRYRYVKGSHKPRLEVDIFEPVALQATPGAQFVPPTPQAAGVGPDRTPAATTTPAQRAAAPAPTRGSTSTIHTVADQMWEAAGRPTNLTVVLNLRKQIMEVLERDHNIKRTTSSTSLGVWQKARLNG